jgi:hypothetical protein
MAAGQLFRSALGAEEGATSGGERRSNTGRAGGGGSGVR